MGGRSRSRNNTAEEAEDGEVEKGASPALIIVVSILTLIIIISGIFIIFFRGSGEFEDVQMGDITEMDTDGDGHMDAWVIDAYAASASTSPAEGEAVLEIFHGNNASPSYRTLIRFRNDRGSVEVSKSDFVIGNGEYTVEIRQGSISSRKTVDVGDVVETLDVEWWGHNRDDIMAGSHDHIVQLMIKPGAGDGDPLDIKGGFPPFELNAWVSDPTNTSHELTITSMTPLSFILMDINHIKKGEYLLTGTWTNLHVRPDSPFRNVTISTNTSYEADAEPYADAGDDIEVIMTGGSVTVDFNASGSWDDCGILEYRWFFGDEEEEDGPTITASPYKTHTYNVTGTMYAYLVVVDDAGQTSKGRWGGFRTVDILNG